ncbi:transglutaminase family protein [Seohaeicola zhoushanensis]|uniref:Transglutaminase n=1 Tax=Seohaeicola zhoushanensis TaxID=1569283 RepID=A0A8J3GYS1_9RHOB|nr:transglutaminase family protein [Seohaeicola zhoushanensis]GHF53393.1 transglutaminase [Seohaeicola zhoushanensis]
MRYRLTMSIRYAFDRPSGDGRQLLRICPARLPGVQQVTSCEVTVTPRPAERRSFTDFFGTEVIELAFPSGLSEVRFDLAAEVRREMRQAGFDQSAPLAALPAEIASVRDLDAQSPHHFLAPSPRVPVVPEISSFAAAAVAGAASVREAVQRLGEALHEAMTFDAKATSVDTPIAEAFAGRQGVCQDMSQIMIAGLRSLGIPAAYVAGFLRTEPPPGQPRLAGADAMHAWVRAWTGGLAGWVEYDPTNACFVDSDHVTVGYGRDYSDIAPVTGMLRFFGAQSGSHSVDIIEI